MKGSMDHEFDPENEDGEVFELFIIYEYVPYITANPKTAAIARN